MAHSRFICHLFSIFVAYHYDLVGDLTGVLENGSTDRRLSAWAYDNLGRPIEQSRPNGATTRWTYDAAGRVSASSHQLATTPNGLGLNFTYNPAGQIVTRVLSNSAYAYTPGARNTAYANNGKNQVTSAGGAPVAYDDRQNIAATAAGSYGYDAFSRLTSASVGGTSAAFAYDPAGRLYQAGASTRFLYDGLQAIGEYDATGQVLKRYVPGLGLDAVLTAYEGATTADRRWLLADERGSVVAITGDAAQVLATNTYDEYGQPGSGNAGRFQYTGQMWLPQAQLYHYRARAYAPHLGRFMQTDPIGYGAGANLYAYVGADPVNWADPLGLTQCVSTTDVTCVGEVVVTADPCHRSGVMCVAQVTQVADVVVTGFRKVLGIRPERPHFLRAAETDKSRLFCPAGQSALDIPQIQWAATGAYQYTGSTNANRRGYGGDERGFYAVSRRGQISIYWSRIIGGGENPLPDDPNFPDADWFVAVHTHPDDGRSSSNDDAVARRIGAPLITITRSGGTYVSCP